MPWVADFPVVMQSRPRDGCDREPAAAAPDRLTLMGRTQI